MGMKTLSSSICLIPLTGCALGIGIIFSGLLYGLTRNPSAYDVVFGLALLGMSLIELFGFICIGICLFFMFF